MIFSNYIYIYIIYGFYISVLYIYSKLHRIPEACVSVWALNGVNVYKEKLV